MDNPRLTVLTEAKVTKLTLSATTCSGVEMLVDDGSAKIDADVEVILSAGAIDTPRLLMLSGIGPAADLKNVDIKTVVDAKGVGQNLQDHIILGGMIYETHEAMAPFNNNLEGSTFFAKSKSGLTSGDLMFVSVQIPYLMPELAALTPPPANSITIAPGLVRIGSRGYLKMLSNRHDGPMDIQPNMLKEQEDLDALVAGVELGQALAERPAFKEMIKSAVVPKINMTRAEKEEFVRASAATYFHPVGTCKMGVDDMSVVDPTLKVHGVEKLRIADASVMPNITGANTNVPSILIGEMAATFIAGL
jgi:choline dehydrogenase